MFALISDGMRNSIVKQWSFSLVLGLIYLAVFHLWMHVERPMIIGTGIVATLLSIALFVLAERQQYYLNAWDRLFHAAVIFDIFLEGLLIPVHNHYGFYLCALGFAVVLGGYRGYLLRRISIAPTPNRSKSHFTVASPE